MTQTNPRQLSLDVLRIIAVLGAIGIHLLYPVFSRPDFLGGKSWWLANLGHAFSLTSVPLFIMISGYFLVGKYESLFQILKRTFNRLIIPYIIWVGLYIIWNSYIGIQHYSLVNILKIAASGNFLHLYFLIILIGLYINRVWLSRLLSSATLTEKKFGFWLAWIVGISMYAILYLNILDGAILNTFTWWIPFLGYFLTGYLIKTKIPGNLQARKSKWVFFTWLLFTIIISYAGVQMSAWNMNFLWHHSGIFYFNTFLSPNIILMSVSFFYWITRGIDWGKLNKKITISKIIIQLSGLTYGTYLIHPMVINWIDLKHRYAIEFVENSLQAFVIQRSFLVVIISFAIAALLKSVPGLRKIVGEK